MSLPRFIMPIQTTTSEGALVPLDAEQARHLSVLRAQPGDALELVLPEGAWRADLAELRKDRALARLVAPLEEDREAPIPLHVYLPLTVQLSLVDEMLPPLVELGATRLQPVAYARSQCDRRKTEARMERWARILQTAAEQSHRGRMPELAPMLPFEGLLAVDLPQRWVAYELPTGESNPRLARAPLALTSGPEGGITDAEFQALHGAGWKPLSLGRAILRAVTAPVAMLGAVQHQLGR